MEDIEIARNTKLEDINVIARKLNVEDDIEQYGKHKAKISLEVMKKLKSKKNGKLILMTAINPTPLGEGKTTMAIGLADGMNKIGKNADNKEINFEDTMKKLENIANELEKGDLDLDTSVSKFEEGMKLSKKCNEILENAEKKNIYINKQW